MPRKSKLFVSACALALLFLAARAASACDCAAGSARPCAHAWSAPVVFSGLVTEISQTKIDVDAGGRREAWPARLVRFNVDESFRGAQAASAEVRTGMDSGDCGYKFVVGRRYLVYANAGSDGVLATGICTPTKPLEEAAADVEFFHGLAHAPDASAIYGSVQFTARDLKTDAYRREQVEGMKIVVEGAGARREVVTDREGKFQLEGLPPGDYTLKPALPEHTGGYVPGRPVTLRAQGCAEVNYYLTWSGQVEGRVFGERGDPLSHVTVSLFPADLDPKDQVSYQHSLTAYVKDGGRYSFDGVPPGRYLLVINPRGTTRAEGPQYPRVFYPGTEDPAQAAAVTVGEGEKVTDRDIRMTRRFVERELAGVVVWPDGRPAKGASALLTTAEQPWSQVGYLATADEQGRFTLKGLEGETFHVVAWVSVDDRRQMCGGPAEVSISSGVEPAPVRIIIDTPYGNCHAKLINRTPPK